MGKSIEGAHTGALAQDGAIIVASSWEYARDISGARRLARAPRRVPIVTHL
jgi:hypothetical protein